MFTDIQEIRFQQISEVQLILGKNKTPWDFDGIDQLLYYGTYQTIEQVLVAKEIWCRYESVGDGCCGFYHQVELGNKKPANNFISDVYVFLVKTLQDRFLEHLRDTN